MEAVDNMIERDLTSLIGLINSVRSILNIIHKIDEKNVYLEMQGEIAELLNVHKLRDEVLIRFVDQLVSEVKYQKKEVIVERLKLIEGCLSSLRESFDDSAHTGH
jgi:hypothetical protein